MVSTTWQKGFAEKISVFEKKFKMSKRGGAVGENPRWLYLFDCWCEKSGNLSKNHKKWYLLLDKRVLPKYYRFSRKKSKIFTPKCIGDKPKRPKMALFGLFKKIESVDVAQIRFLWKYNMVSNISRKPHGREFFFLQIWPENPLGQSDRSISKFFYLLNRRC